jgi:hypothetical protein
MIGASEPAELIITLLSLSILPQSATQGHLRRRPKRWEIHASFSGGVRR